MAKDPSSPSGSDEATGRAAKDAASTAAASKAAAGAAGGSTPVAPADPAKTVEGAPNPDATRAAEAVLAAGRPAEATRAAQAAGGSALDAPGVGSGPAGEAARRAPFAVEGGVPVAALGETGFRPGVFTREGSFAAPPELGDFGEDADRIRRASLAAALRRAPYTAEKLAAPRPTTPAAIADYIDAGFDMEITARQRGFRRAGVAHPVDPTLRRSRDFTATEMKALLREPMLIVTPLRGELSGHE